MPFIIRLCIVLAILFYTIAKIIAIAYHKEINVARLLGRGADCLPGLIAGSLFLLTVLFSMIALFWLILFGLA